MRSTPEARAARIAEGYRTLAALVNDERTARPARRRPAPPPRAGDSSACRTRPEAERRQRRGGGQTSGIVRPGSDITLLPCLNAHSDLVNFRLPPFVGGTRWFCLIDMNDRTIRSATTSRSFLLFAGIIAGEPDRAVRRLGLELTRDDAFAG
jgi:hypothetical protein